MDFLDIYLCLSSYLYFIVYINININKLDFYLKF